MQFKSNTLICLKHLTICHFSVAAGVCLCSLSSQYQKDDLFLVLSYIPPLSLITPPSQFMQMSMRQNLRHTQEVGKNTITPFNKVQFLRTAQF